MQDFIGSVRRSLVFKPSAAAAGNDDGVGASFGGFVEKIGSSIRKSRIGLFNKSSVQALPPPRRMKKEEAGSQIRWRKGELIGCGAFGRVYMGMNLDSGELLAVKQVSIIVNTASKDKTQAHIRELEEEVKLLKNLSHPNIVRYLGTAREEESLNIFLEFVPGGSISSLLGKFGSFPESVIRMYTKQILLGLEYLHKNGIMHRDIKGANILVDNKGQIKLADFGASKKVVELATMTGAKSMKGTPYWMAPEVILQTGHSFSADIWSVGCTVIEMATGKPPWSEQYQEVAALFHIGTTKAHPPIPDHLSSEAKEFLLKCLQKEPDLRSNASELLQHPFVTGEYNETHPVFRTSVMVKDTSGNQLSTSRQEPTKPISPEMKTKHGAMDAQNMNSVRCSTIYPEKFSGGPMWGSNRYDDDMCQLDDDLMAGTSMKLDSTLLTNNVNKSFNPMNEPDDDWSCRFDGSPEVGTNAVNLFSCQVAEISTEIPGELGNEDNDFTFPNGTPGVEEDEEDTEIKIRAFLDEKALDLKKMQTPLYEEFYNSLNAAISPVGNENKENSSSHLNLPPKSKSPNSNNRLLRKRLSSAVDVSYIGRSANRSDRVSNIGGVNDPNLHECLSPSHAQLNENVLDSQKHAISPSASFSERQRRWKEELAEELERKRELMRQAGTSSPKDRIINNRQKRFSFLGN
ncbi:putative mitogen-activated protein kinase kinase kinase STE-STE11 family [Helianthus annuus]|nr:putative mitogen-activated protein kinase kinase kinase STE-STE11 family [Helianthus annuus]KAJ0865381.1 putative mitogen-activated protein kinase kinase kinase STE-STE11 family [Helianthus annuus]